MEIDPKSEKAMASANQNQSPTNSKLQASNSSPGDKSPSDPQPGDNMPRRSLDVSRAERLFNFRAVTPFDLGLKNTIEWYLRTHVRKALAV